MRVPPGKQAPPTAADLLVVSGDLNLDPGNASLLTLADLASSVQPAVGDQLQLVHRRRQLHQRLPTEQQLRDRDGRARAGNARARRHRYGSCRPRRGRLLPSRASLL